MNLQPASQVVGLGLPPEIVRAVDAAARREFTSRAAWIRKAVADRLALSPDRKADLHA